MDVCSVFCRDQKRALMLLRDKQRDSKYQRLAQIMQVTHTQRSVAQYSAIRHTEHKADLSNLIDHHPL